MNAPLAPAGTTSYSGGTFLSAGILNVTTNTALGLASNPINRQRRHPPVQHSG
jgi:hypothetical protein